MKRNVIKRLAIFVSLFSFLCGCNSNSNDNSGYDETDWSDASSKAFNYSFKNDVEIRYESNIRSNVASNPITTLVKTIGIKDDTLWSGYYSYDAFGGDTYREESLAEPFTYTYHVNFSNDRMYVNNTTLNEYKKKGWLDFKIEFIQDDDSPSGFKVNSESYFFEVINNKCPIISGPKKEEIDEIIIDPSLGFVLYSVPCIVNYAKYEGYTNVKDAMKVHYNNLITRGEGVTYPTETFNYDLFLAQNYYLDSVKLEPIKDSEDTYLNREVTRYTYSGTNYRGEAFIDKESGYTLVFQLDIFKDSQEEFTRLQYNATSFKIGEDVVIPNFN